LQSTLADLQGADKVSTKDLFPSWRGNLPWEGRAAALAAAYRDHAAYASLDDHIRRQPGDGYHVAPTLAASLDGLDAGARRQLLYGLLVWQMRQFPARFAVSGLAGEFTAHYGDCFHRIMDGIEAGSLPADLRIDAFVKDLALTRLVLVPAIAQLIYPHGRVLLKPLLRWGPSGWVYVYGRCGGRHRFLEIHTHDPMAGEFFNAPGWEETYRLAALLLRTFKRHRGLVGYSWFYDPALEQLSPRLNYLRHSPISQGARLMPMDVDEDSARLATATSATRREAYIGGRYIPRRHGLVWSRADIVQHYCY
jgi:hypothetical protein